MDNLNKIKLVWFQEDKHKENETKPLTKTPSVSNTRKWMKQKSKLLWKGWNLHKPKMKLNL